MPNWSKILNHPLFNMGFFLVVRQITKVMDLDNPEYKGMMRGLYLGSQILIFALSMYLMSVINKKNDTTSLRYVEPGTQQWDGTETTDKLINTTNKDYDLDEVKKQMKQGFTNIAVIAFLHLKFGYVQPLIIQSILGFKTFFMSKEARIHFFNGKTTSGELRRPFRVEAPFNMVNEKRQPKTDKGSIKRAEKALKAQ
ncbi:MAG: inorganic phosphate transporter Pho88 [Benjaminiella poitrasii]|nr:MAG: inorganic phosphate transporter Pho88 [Benjaminiella poitrasii]KAI9481017.1 MAG: inorganic phosphate transporter Pho88 [Benjaminiella poitrasii]